MAEKKRIEKEQREALILREPSEIFKDEAYKKFKIASYDDNGIPTHTTDGKELQELPAKIRAKFGKDYEKHVKARDELLAKKQKEA